MRPFKLVTRSSRLALWQAEMVSNLLKKKYPNIKIEIIAVKTMGDKIVNLPLASFGGKGLFVKELEECLLNKTANFAVHCVKDMPMQRVPELTLNTILKRDDPRDVLISEGKFDLHTLPHQAIVGTTSPRRQSQLLSFRPDLKIVPLRGNIDTRLSKLKSQNLDAIVLAAAGLSRLNLDELQTAYYLDDMIPAIGQGALGIECRIDDDETLELIQCLNDPISSICIDAERSMCATLKGDCQSPIGGYAYLQDNKLKLQGLVGNLQGSIILRSTHFAELNQAQLLGHKVGMELLDKGAREILDT